VASYKHGNEPSGHIKTRTFLTAELDINFTKDMKMKFTVFWDVLPRSHIDVDRRFRGACCLNHQDYTAVHPRIL
jgi:hypothetical protein